MFKKTYIYTLSIDDNIKYVGKSNEPHNRLKGHLKECKKRKTRKDKWLFLLKEKGIKPQLEILDEVDEKDWSIFEQYWISQLKCWGFNLLNGTEGGEGSDGFRGKKHSKETIEKCRLAALNQPSWNKNLKYEVHKRRGYIWINKEEDKKIIDPSKLEKYLSEGWIKGRGKY